MGFVDDEQPHAGLICSAVPRSTRLLFLVRTHPAEFAVRLPADASGKDGWVAGGHRGGLYSFGIEPHPRCHVERSETSLSTFVGYRSDQRFFPSPRMTL